jgi:hypothetical protein
MQKLYILLTLLTLLITASEGFAESTTTTTVNPSGTVTTTTTSEGDGIKTRFSIEQTQKEHDQAKQFAEQRIAAIVSCTQADLKTPYPLNPKTTWRAQVHGMVGDKCKFTESFDAVTISCMFTEAQRKEVGAKGQDAFAFFFSDQSICQANPSN